MRRSSLSYLPSTLVIDIPEIDAQHAHLFEQLDEFKPSCIDHNAYQADEAEALFATLAAHCRTEERLAGEAGLDFRRHGEKHRVMLRGIRKMLDDMEKPGADVFSLIRYVDYWFERHIQEEDRNLGINLKQLAFAEVGEQFADEFLGQRTSG